MLKLRALFLSLALILCSTPSVFAGEAESNALMQMIQNMKIDKKQISGMLDMMVSQGQITKKDAEAAKKQLAQMSDNDMQKLQQNALDKVKTGAKGEGLNKEHQKMLDEMKKRYDTSGTSKN